MNHGMMLCCPVPPKPTNAMGECWNDGAALAEVERWPSRGVLLKLEVSRTEPMLRHSVMSFFKYYNRKNEVSIAMLAETGWIVGHKVTYQTIRLY